MLFLGKFNDLTGKNFGRLTVIERAPDHIVPSGRRYVRWRCLCECGNEVFPTSDALTRGKTVSCGCHSRDVARDTHLSHGESHTRLYQVWSAIKRRCYNPNARHYESYGGRGIQMCDEWKNSYETFRDWAISTGYQELPFSKCTIDRIDNNGNYEPSNCRWVDGVAQANNRRSNRRFTYNGETNNIKEWSDIYGIPYKLLHGRLYTGWSIEKALTT